MDFYISQKVTAIENKGKEIVLKAEPKNGGAAIELKGDYCLVSVGRRPDTDGLGLDKVGIETGKGRMPGDVNRKPKVVSVYTVGLACRGAVFAHKAAAVGV